MKVIIAGGRDFDNFRLLSTKVNSILCEITSDIEIVCGCAKGADDLGRKYAKNLGYKIKEFPADWDAHGKFAGVKRNREMAEYADALIAFWDGKSKGTKNMIEEAKKRGLKVRVIKYLLKSINYER